MKSILVVDDDVAIRSLIIDALAEDGYHHTRQYGNGLQAITALQKDRFDLVISDVSMPGMSGLDLLSMINDLESPPPVIIVTAYPKTDITVSAMKEGAFDFLAKPFRVEDLLFKVNLCLREQSVQADQQEPSRRTDGNPGRGARELATIKLISERIERTRQNDDEIFEDIVTVALSLTSAEHCLIALFDRERETFHEKMFRSRRINEHDGNDCDSALLARAEGLFRNVVQCRTPLLQNGDPTDDRIDSYIIVPLLIRNTVFGVLALMGNNPGAIFTRRDLSHVHSLAERASLYLENTVLYESTFSSIMNTFASLIHSIHVRDNYTERHSRSVTEMALATAQAMGCSSEQTESLKIAAHLHDIGKIAIPDRILLKPDRLTGEEYEVITGHAAMGESILSSIALFEQERRIVRHHHERWDGTGYPDKMAGEEIPFLARILSVADTFDAMTSDRPYRKGLPLDAAQEELLKNRWKQFDGRVVDRFLAAVAMERTQEL